MVNKKKVKRNDWFAVSPDGLSQHYSKEFILRELIANCLDEDGDKIVITIESAIVDVFPSQYLIRIIDNDPDGFDNTEDMYCLFRKTKKVDDTQVRGRFNHGEKGVISLCNKAILSSTKGTVYFNDDGTRTQDNNIRTNIGSDLRFWVDLDKEEYEYLLNYPKLLKIPKGFTIEVNNNAYEYEKPLKQCDLKLQTWKSNEKSTYFKNTKVSIYPQLENKSWIMELGIPIQEIEYPMTIDVQQKIPLDTKRNAVKKTYLEDLYGQLGNYDFVIDKFDEDDMSEEFITTTLSSNKLSPESAVKIIKKKIGSKKIIIENPFDQWANEEAMKKGYTLMKPRQIPKNARELIKVGGIPTTSEVFKQGNEPPITVKRDEWNEGMKWMSKWAKSFARASIHCSIRVIFINNPNITYNAFYKTIYGSGELTYNIGQLGKNFFQPKNIAQISELLLHELAHNVDSELPHLSMAYINELQRIAGVMVKWLMNDKNRSIVYNFINSH
jgi:hypothetical protein